MSDKCQFSMSACPQQGPKSVFGRASIGLIAVASLVLAGCQTGQVPGSEWVGSCPTGDDDPSLVHVVALELSPSERGQDLIDSRLASAEAHVRQAVDCEAPLRIVLLDRGRIDEVHRSTISDELGNEAARDRRVPAKAEEVMDDVMAAIDRSSQVEPPFSDPGVIFRYLGELLARLDAEGSIIAVMLSDGVTNTPDLTLNGSLVDSGVDELAIAVAPPVDLQYRVDIDWSGIGLTADRDAAPSEWIDRLAQIWTEACHSRNASSCVITTN